MANNSKIVINGTTYQGRSVVIGNGQIVIDGKNITPDDKQINISVLGDIDRLEVDVCEKVSVNGNVGHVETQSGNVEVSGDVNGGIQTMSGSVLCGNISGSVKTMSGSIVSK
jgi:hypothetical protein